MAIHQCGGTVTTCRLVRPTHARAWRAWILRIARGEAFAEAGVIGLKLAAVLFAGVLGCGRGSSAAGSPLERSVSGDTVITVARNVPGTDRVTAFDVIWQDTSLKRPRHLLATGDHLVISEDTELHFINLIDRSVRTVGRPGEGPGEFRSIRAFGAVRDSIAVYDLALRRMSIITPTLSFARSSPLHAYPPFVGVRRRNNVLLAVNGGLVLLLESNPNVSTGDPVRAALVWQDLNGDSARIVNVWNDVTFLDVPGTRYLIREKLFPQEVVIAVSHDGRFAHGDGMLYCITVESVQVVPGYPIQRFCREWQPPLVGSGIRNVDMHGMRDDLFQRSVRMSLRRQRIPDHLPSYDKALFDALGRLWIRTVPGTLADIHPSVLERYPFLGPTLHYWDVFARDGVLVRTVAFPARFDVRAITLTHAFGFLELDSGEIVIATMPLESS